MSDTRDLQDLDDCDGDEAYFDRRREGRRVFDSALLREPAIVLRARKPLVFSRHESATDAMRAMQAEHRGCVLITGDGTSASPLEGIFTERDVLFRIVDRGRNPATLPLADVMTPDPDRAKVTQPIGAVLHMMNVGGFRHIPVVDEEDHPVFVVSVKDVVQFLVDAFPREILNLAGVRPAKPQRERDGA
jgi:signal-transduction protein with cAMP-binding, CBS, and nucleotidyltransferase domain